jgi:hypothetical protein
MGSVPIQPNILPNTIARKVNLQLLSTLIPLLSEGNRAESIQENLVGPLYIAIGPEMVYLGSGCI